MPWSRREHRDLMHLLELDANVLAYRSATEKVTYLLDGHERTHVPAFRVRTRRGHAILDAFPDHEHKTDARRQTVATMTELYADRGLPYRAFPATKIRTEPRFGNARWLLRERAYRPEQNEVFKLTAFLSVRDSATIAEIRASADKLPNLSGLICALLIRGQLSADLSAREPEGIRIALMPEHAR